MTTHVYIPIEKYSEILRHLKLAQIETNKSIAKPVVDLRTLKCVLFSFEGIETTVRTPFAFPFIGSLMRGEFRQPLHLLEDVDWMYLGGSVKRFVDQLEQHCLALGAVVTPIPFQSFTHSVPQLPVVDEFHVTIPRVTKNYNEDNWQDKRTKFGKINPKEWGALSDVNTGSYEHLVEEFAIPRLQQPPKVIVDLGSGLGKTTYGLARLYPEASVYGLELSESALDIARQHFQAPNLTFLQHDISRPLAFEDGSIDVLVSINALAYAKNQQKTADDIFTKLAPDGIFFNHSRIGYAQDFWEFPFSLIWPVIFQIYPETWADSAGKKGFSTHIMPPQLSRKLTPWSFGHPMEAATKKALELCSRQLQKEDVTAYYPSITHALMLHSRHVTDNMDEHTCNGKTRQDVFTHCFQQLEAMPNYVQWTARFIHQQNIKQLQLCDTGIDYCKRAANIAIAL